MAVSLNHTTLVTTASTADQVILSVTFAANTNIKMLALGSSYTTYSGTEANLGLGRFQYYVSSWTQIFEQRYQNTDLDNNCGMSILPLGSGITIPSGNQLRAICTPASTTSMRWPASIWGEY
jgi:hypothetical protein